MTDKPSEKPAEKPAKRPLQLTSDNSRRVRITRKILRILGDLVYCRTTCKCTVSGLEHMPKSGPTMVLFNHVTMIDPIMAGAFIRWRDGNPIGKAELSRTPIGLVVWGWDTIPLRRGELDMTALRRAMMVLESSDYLMIAPEGHRNRDGLRNPKEGFVMLAAKANAIMVPCGISGTEKFRATLKRFRRVPISINYGRPVRLKGKISRKDYPLVAEELMYQLSPLVAPELRGNYADLSKATMNYIEYAD